MALKMQVVSTEVAATPVPENVKKEFETVYKELSKKDGQKAHLEFDTAEELTNWMRDARNYAKTREPKPLRLRQLNSKNLPDNQVWVQITDDIEEGGQRNGRPNTR